MLGIADLVVGGVVPGVVALLLRQAALRGGVADRVAWPLSVGVAFVAGQAALAAPLAGGVAGWAAGLPPALGQFASPREASQWLPAAVSVAVVVALLAGVGRPGRYAATALGVLLAVGLPLRLLWGSVYTTTQWSHSEAAVWIAAMAVALVAIGCLLARRPAETPRRTALLRDLFPAVVALGVAAVLATSGSLSYARLAGAVAAAIGGAALGGLGVSPTRRVGVEAAAPVVATLLGAMILLGYFFAEVTAPNALLLLAALAATGLPLPTALSEGWRALALRGGLCLVLVTVAAGSSGVAFAKAVSAQPANPYAGWQGE